MYLPLRNPTGALVATLITAGIMLALALVGSPIADARSSTTPSPDAATAAPRAEAPQFDAQAVIEGQDAGDQAGMSVAVIDGMFAFIGVPDADVYIPGEDITIDNAGAVYVYECSGGDWTLLQTITDTETVQGVTNVPWENENFGASVAAMLGDGGGDVWLAIGAPGTCAIEAGVPAGAVDIWWLPPIYPLTPFEFVQTITNGLDYGMLGTSVALEQSDGTVWLLAGQPGNGETCVYGSNLNVPEFGASTSFWGPADFGSAVALDIDGNNGTAVVGAPQADNGSVDKAGSATFFPLTNGSWSTTGQTVYGPAANAALGTSVAVAGSAAVAGMPGYSPPGEVGAGGAVTYTQNASGTWVAGPTLQQSVASAGAQFGASVSFDGATCLVGAPADGGGSAGSGSVTVYDVSGSQFAEAQTLTSGTSGDAFGAGTFVDDSTAVVGAPLASPGGLAQAGSASVYSSDSSAPSVAALRTVDIRRGHRVTLRYRVKDDGPRARVVIRIVRVRPGKHATRKTIILKSVPTNRNLACSFKCWLPPGRYRWTVHAKDAAGHRERKPATRSLTVKPRR